MFHTHTHIHTLKTILLTLISTPFSNPFINFLTWLLQMACLFCYLESYKMAD